MVYFPAARLHGIKHPKGPKREPVGDAHRLVVARWEEVLALTLEGFTVGEIAEELKIDNKTVIKIQRQMHCHNPKKDV